MREQRSVRHGYADAELDVKAMAKIDITEVTALNGQSVGFDDLAGMQLGDPGVAGCKVLVSGYAAGGVLGFAGDGRDFLFGFFTSMPLPCRPCRGRCPFLGRFRSERDPGPAGFE